MGKCLIKSPLDSHVKFTETSMNLTNSEKCGVTYIFYMQFIISGKSVKLEVIKRSYVLQITWDVFLEWR